jgi:hypothetical protein
MATAKAQPYYSPYPGYGYPYPAYAYPYAFFAPYSAGVGPNADNDDRTPHF